jgi:hypothetical protein
MRHHPISPVTEPLQYRAIGVVRGHYRPSDPDQLTRGTIVCDDGSEVEAVVLGRLLTLLRRHVDLDQPHLWVVYPRYRHDTVLHLQMVGLWEPSTLTTVDGENDGAEPVAADALPEGDNYFSIRGDLIFTRPDQGELAIKIRPLAKADGSRALPFKLQVKGELPVEALRHFVSLDVHRVGQELHLDGFEVIAPLNQRSSRGGKGSRGERGRGGPRRPRSGREGPGAPGDSTPAAPRRSGGSGDAPVAAARSGALRRPTR